LSMNTIIDNYKVEKEGRERRLLAYADAMQKSTLESSAQIIRELVEERHRQNMTQQEVSEITGILPSNLARFESGTRIPTLLVLQKYASALGKTIKLRICDEDNE
jgi:DNA-binding XRE family transcriptional regulator